MTRILLATIMALATAAWAGVAHAQAQPGKPPIVADTPCRLAGVLLAQMAAQPFGGAVIYDDEPFTPTKIAFSATSSAPPPDVPPDLAQRWAASGPSNLLLACPALRRTLPPGLRLATNVDRAAAVGIQHGPVLNQISAPVANAAGDRVLIEVRGRCALLCGSGVVRHFQKTRRGWVELGTVGMWLS